MRPGISPLEEMSEAELDRVREISGGASPKALATGASRKSATCCGAKPDGLSFLLLRLLSTWNKLRMYIVTKNSLQEEDK